VLCDALARLTFRALGTEPPVGAITALLGGPLFLLLLARPGPADEE
jgi:iron complex transport system permease protein